LQGRRRYCKAIKRKITLDQDADVLGWFKSSGGPGYQTRINRALWEAITEERKISGK